MRRLRENTMLDTEITKTGEVVVEGHKIGRLDGFRFAPEAGSERFRREGAFGRGAKSVGAARSRRAPTGSPMRPTRNSC